MTSLLSEEVQLGYALEAFAYAHQLGRGWVSQKLLYLSKAGISSMNLLSTGCKDETIDLDLEIICGIPQEERISELNVKRLKNFLPGPVGFRAFRLATKCAKKVKKNEAETNYVHRPEDGKIGKEKWRLPVDDDWTLNVDCAGFVRNVLKHVTKDPFRMALSDRDFMRAKDFYRFFETIPQTVIDQEDMVDVDDKRMKWRIVPDLRMVIPGDIIVYRPRGNAAGGAAFTENDRDDIKHLLRAVKTAQLWHQEEQCNQQEAAAATDDNDEQGSSRKLVTRNVAKDPVVKPWVESTRKRLLGIGIDTVKKLKSNYTSLNALLKRDCDDFQFSTEELTLIKECYETTAMNTGHIVFASGPAVLKDSETNQYRIKIIHSTKYGRDGQQGIEEYYRRFHLVVGGPGGNKAIWTREMKKAKSIDADESDDDDDNPNDDMEEDPDDDDEGDNDEAKETEQEEEEGASGDDLAGQADVEVLAARMCF